MPTSRCATAAIRSREPSLPAAPAHARIDACTWMTIALLCPPPWSLAHCVCATTSASLRSLPPTGTPSRADGHSSRTPFSVRWKRRAARRPPPDGRRATSLPGAVENWSAQCRSTPRHIPMASTYSTGRGPTPTTGTDAVTTRSSSPRSRLRRHRDAGCSPATTWCAPRCCAPRWGSSSRLGAPSIRRSRRCTCCFRPCPRRERAKPPAWSSGTGCSSAGRIGAIATSPIFWARSVTTSARR